MLPKLDLDTSYLILHVTPEQSFISITIIEDISYLETRIPFGAAAVPSLYRTVSGGIFDVTNDILSKNSWNLNDLQSPLSSKFDFCLHAEDSTKI